MITITTVLIINYSKNNVKIVKEVRVSKSIKGTETEKNLVKAFAGESQARNRYTFFASVARKEGYE